MNNNPLITVEDHKQISFMVMKGTVGDGREASQISFKGAKPNTLEALMIVSFLCNKLAEPIPDDAPAGELQARERLGQIVNWISSTVGEMRTVNHN